MARYDETSMAAVFQNQAEKYGTRACVAYKKEGAYVDISWKEMNEMVRSISSLLISSGIRKGDRVAIFSPNRYEWWVADLALLSVGAVDVPIYATNSAEEALYVLHHSKSRACFVGEEEQLGKILEIREKLVINARFDKKGEFEGVIPSGLFFGC